MSVNDGDSGFTADDVYRLEQSIAWQQQPDLIETLCRLLHDMDPMGVCSGGNPHAMTEYLVEITALVARMSDIQSEQDVASALAEICAEKFDGHPALCDWGGLARVAWPTLVDLQKASG